jgi:autotransporter passenger strand-loop-strand repeat protein
MQINVVYDASVDQNADPSLNAPAGFKDAINYVVNLFDNLFTNNVTITLAIGWGEHGATPANPAGNPIPDFAGATNDPVYGATYTYAQINDALLGIQNQSADQQSAYSNLPPGGPFFGAGLFNGTPFQPTTENLLALGLISGTGVGESVGFARTSDLSGIIAAAEHEITEGMGRVTHVVGGPGYENIIDLFRFSGPGSLSQVNGPGFIAQGTGDTANFSIDNGFTTLGQWNNDVSLVNPKTGIGIPYDLADWAPGQGPGPGGDDAFGDGTTLTLADIALMNVIGWNLSVPSNHVPNGVTDFADTIGQNGFLVVESGGTAISNILNGGEMIVSAGGFASATQILSSGWERVFGTEISATISGGLQEVIGIASATQVTSSGSRAGLVEVFEGGQAIDAIVGDHGVLDVESGGQASRAAVGDQGDLLVASGGVAIGTTIAFGGIEAVDGLDETATVSDGEQFVDSGGVALGTKVNHFGLQTISAGGLVVNASLDSGTQDVFGEADGSNVGSGGIQIVEAGVTVDGAIVDGGKQCVLGTATTTDIFDHGTQIVSAGGSASLTILGHGNQDVLFGGLASGTTIESGGTESVSGTDRDATVDLGGYQYVMSGGVASDTQVDGGNQYVLSSGVASGTQVDFQGSQTIISGGLSVSTTVGDGTQDVVGEADATTVNAGGSQLVESGGIASSTTVDAGGSAYVSSGGSAFLGIVSGALTVSSGGLASGATVTGGTMDVAGTASATAIVDGGLERVSGVDVSAFINNATQHVVAGGTAREAIDNGQQLVDGGAATYSTTVRGNGQMDDGGIANQTVVDNGGVENVTGLDIGANLNGTQNVENNAVAYTATVWGVTIVITDTSGEGGPTSLFLSGLQDVYGSAIGTILSGGEQDVEVGGSATDTVVDSGGVEKVHGSDFYATVNSGGTQYVEAGGVATSATVNGGLSTPEGPPLGGPFGNTPGIQIVSAGGQASGTALSGGELDDYGSASQTIINSGGIERVYGEDKDATVIAGGVQFVEAGGVATGAIVTGNIPSLPDGGPVGPPGSLPNPPPSFPGTQVILADGEADGTSLIFGNLIIRAGGTAKEFATAAPIGTVIDDGKLVFDLVGGDASLGGTLNGSGTLTIQGGGKLTIGGGDAFTGAVTIKDSALELTSAGAAGSGAIGFAGGLLQIDGTAMPTNTIGFASNDRINLAGVNLVAGSTATLEAGNILHIVEGANTYDLQLDPSQSFLGEYFKLSSDVITPGSTDITLAQIPTVSWIHHTGGSWDVAGNWSPQVVPGALADAALLTVGGNHTITSAKSRTVYSVQTGAGVILDVTSGTFAITAGTFSNDARAGSNAGTVKVEGAATLDISGVFDNTSSGTVSAAHAGATVDLLGGDISGGRATIAAGATLKADGGPSQAGTLANVAVTDSGTLLATDQTTLTLRNATVNAAGGTIEARDGVAQADATVALDGTTTINGGTLTTLNGGVIETVAGSTGTLKGVTISPNSVVTVADQSALSLRGIITDKGTLALDAQGDPTGLLIDAVRLAGGGAVTLSDSAFNDVTGVAAGGTLDNIDTTISGAGVIGGSLALTNETGGAIDATGTNQLLIDTGHDKFVNRGVIEATTGTLVIQDSILVNTGTIFSAGTLNIVASKINNTAGIIAANGPAAGIYLYGAKIFGGTLATPGNAVIQTLGSAASFLNAVTIIAGSTVRVSDATTLALEGTITNDGTIDVNGTGDATTLQIGPGHVRLTGGGEVQLSDDSGNSISGARAGVALDNADNTIVGAGEIGNNSNRRLTLSNGGTIDAHGNRTLVIDTGNTVSNRGVMEATGSGGLTIDDTVANTGTIEANGGDVTIMGNLTGKGWAEIFGNSTMEFAAAAGHSETNAVVFESGSAGLLKLDVANNFSGTVAGFAAGDDIELVDFRWSGTPQITKATATTAGGITTTSVTIKDGSQGIVLKLVSASASEFPPSTSAYSLSSDNSRGDPGTLFHLAAPAG